MTTEVERLLDRLEVTQRRFEKQLQAASRSADRNARNMERRFQTMNKHVTASLNRIGKSAGSAFSTVSRLALAAASGFGVRELVRYADAWTQIENEIKAAEQISGTAARSTSQLNDIAATTRAGLEETASLYARLLRVSGQLGASEENVAQATETVAKAFKAGGAAATEQAAGILQLSQALGSGVLQGDELRSLRENAPIIAQAIADEFETTIGGLKELGSEGELVAGRVFAAILNAQEDIDAAFAATTPTVADGFTAMKNGAMEFVAAFSDGSGATDALASGLQNLGGFLADSAEAARRFGARSAEAFRVVREALQAIPLDLDFGKLIKDIDAARVEVVTLFSDMGQAVYATVSGVGAAVKQAMINVIAATGDAGVGIANAAIDTIEGILQGVLDGVQLVLDGINAVINRANEIPGVDLPTFGGLGAVELPRLDASIAEQAKPIGEAFSDAVHDAADAWQDWEDAAVSAVRRIQYAGQAPFDPYDPRGNQLAPPTPTAQRAPFVPIIPEPQSDWSPGGGRGRRSSAETPFFEQVKAEVSALEDKMRMIGMTTAEIAEYEARQKLLNEAKKRSLDLDLRNSKTGQTLREEIDRQAKSIGDLTEKYEGAKAQADFFEASQKQLQSGMVDAIVEGENLAGVFENLAKTMAKAALEAALFGSGPLGGALGGAGGNGLLGSVVSAAFGVPSFDGGGYTGAGVRAGGLDGKGGRLSVVHPNETIIDHTRSGGAGVNVNIINNAGAEVSASQDPNGNITVAVERAMQTAWANGSMDRVVRQRHGLRPQGA